jgi:integrase
MARAWIFQDDHQVKKHGTEKASWYVGWIDPEGRRRSESCGPGSMGKKAAFRLKQKREGELREGTYQANRRKRWADFRKEYETKILQGKAVGTRGDALIVLGHFERIIKPARVQAVTSKTIADYVAQRRTESGMRPGTLVSPATINKELRTLRAMFRTAKKWKYLHEPPEFDFQKEPEKLATYIPPEDLAALYGACDKAKYPRGLPYSAGDWWRALLVAAYMTGWRIGALLALLWEDVDLDEGCIITRAEHNKGKRDAKVIVHPLVVDHLRKLVAFHRTVFPWRYNRRKLYEEFDSLQVEAKIRPGGRKARYGFHDFRRAFATMNALNMTGDALQHLMQHRDYGTTQRYINIARQLTPAVQNLFVPKLAKVGPA